MRHVFFFSRVQIILMNNGTYERFCSSFKAEHAQLLFLMLPPTLFLVDEIHLKEQQRLRLQYLLILILLILSSRKERQGNLFRMIIAVNGCN